MSSTSMRIIGLAARTHSRSKGRFLLLSTLISVGIVIFLVVGALSRASTSSLDRAIEEGSGATGTYRVVVQPIPDVSESETTRRIADVLAAIAVGPLWVASISPRQATACPPATDPQEARLAVLRSPDHSPVDHRDPAALDREPAEIGDNVDAATQVCLDGLRVTDGDTRSPSPAERFRFGDEILIVDPRYVPSIGAADPTETAFVVVTGRTAGLTEAIQERISAAFSPELSRWRINPTSVLSVSRLDSDAQVRAASEGVRLVYALIGWGVLLLGGLGVLVAQLMMLRDRTWFFGLARAVGARPADVTKLVIADAAIVVLCGSVVALVAGVALDPVVRSFAEQSFQTDASLFGAGLVPQLIVGIAALLLLGSAYPAWKATRLDPVDVLERR